MPNIWTTISVPITFSRLKNAEVRRVNDRVNNTCAAHMRSRAFHSPVGIISAHTLTFVGRAVADAEIAARDISQGFGNSYSLIYQLSYILWN